MHSKVAMADPLRREAVALVPRARAERTAAVRAAAKEPRACELGPHKEITEPRVLLDAVLRAGHELGLSVAKKKRLKQKPMPLLSRLTLLSRLSPVSLSLYLSRRSPMNLSLHLKQ